MALLLCDLDDTFVSIRDIFRAWATSYLAAVGAPPEDLDWLVETDETARCGETLDGGWMIGDNPVNDIGGAAACGSPGT